MLIATFVLFHLLIVVYFADELAKEGKWILRRIGVLPHLQVEFDGLLDELYAKWPLDWDEYSPQEILAFERAEDKVPSTQRRPVGDVQPLNPPAVQAFPL